MHSKGEHESGKIAMKMKWCEMDAMQASEEKKKLKNRFIFIQK